ncbi:acyl-CoA thioesterase [Hylemonella sp. W303a]|uniref:acyl-CoA thioesterase n=1 Tax=Hylemonella sp. W303a TaxID=3389873 RepID=UPI00396B18DF
MTEKAGQVPEHTTSQTGRHRPGPERREAYRVFRRFGTRWMDNDAYGHANNAAYFSWFDTAVNAWLIEQSLLNIESGQTIGLVVENHCNYFASVGFPQDIEVGLRVGHVGSSSVRYELGIFALLAETASAQGHLVHVYVDRTTRRPVSLPSRLRSATQALYTPASE